MKQHIVIVAPEPFEAQLPAVNEIADEVKIAALGDAEKIQQLGDTRVFRAQMDVGNPDGTVAQFGRG